MATCPHCKSINPVSDADHDRMIETGVFGAGCVQVQVCDGARYGFDWVPPEFLAEDPILLVLSQINTSDIMEFMSRRVLKDANYEKRVQ